MTIRLFRPENPTEMQNQKSGLVTRTVRFIMPIRGFLGGQPGGDSGEIVLPGPGNVFSK